MWVFSEYQRWYVSLNTLPSRRFSLLYPFVFLSFVLSV